MVMPAVVRPTDLPVSGQYHLSNKVDPSGKIV
jgi:hypothetical protein